MIQASMICGGCDSLPQLVESRMLQAPDPKICCNSPVCWTVLSLPTAVIRPHGQWQRGLWQILFETLNIISQNKHRFCLCIGSGLFNFAKWKYEKLNGKKSSFEALRRELQKN